MKAILSVVEYQPNVQISAIIPVADRHDEIEMVTREYFSMLVRSGRTFEMIYVVDGMHPAVVSTLQQIEATNPAVKVMMLNQYYGEAACIREGVKRASGDVILLLPPYLQVMPDSIITLLGRLDTADVVTAVRDRKDDQFINRFRGWVFEKLARIAGSHFADPGCSVRALKRHVFDEMVLQDEQHRFLPLFAERLGFTVQEVLLPQAESDKRHRQHSLHIYLGRMLDLISISFLLRFLQKPFRFFGSVGAGSIFIGTLIGLYITAERFFANVAMGDRPMLLLAVLMIVLGIQIAAIGLIAEIVIFTRSKGTPTYHIDHIAEKNGKDLNEPA
jgi:hypothetical protein